MKGIKIKRFILSAVSILFLTTGFSQTRKELSIPDIPGYITLKCDFHMHTVFSDGSVWPTTRVIEAWLQGLDAISITDHLENYPRKKELIGDDNTSYDIAAPKAKQLGLLLVKAAEITKSMPPGHFNTLFIKDANPLDLADHRKALQIAHEQGAFVMWNHPGWKAQAPDSAIWYDEHSYLYEKGWFQGIEIFNSDESYGLKVYTWAKEKKLAIFANTDIHGVVNMKYDLENSHRPMTLVFSKEKTLDGIKEALFSKRTAAYFNDTIIGHEPELSELFKASIDIKNKEIKVRKNKTDYIHISNNSDLDYELILNKESDNFFVPDQIILKAHQTSLLPITGKTKIINKIEEITLPYLVGNLVVLPDKNLNVYLKVKNLN